MKADGKHFFTGDASVESSEFLEAVLVNCGEDPYYLVNELIKKNDIIYYGFHLPAVEVDTWDFSGPHSNSDRTGPFPLLLAHCPCSLLNLPACSCSYGLRRLFYPMRTPVDSRGLLQLSCALFCRADCLSILSARCLFRPPLLVKPVLLPAVLRSLRFACSIATRGLHL
ncbi:hypothetical protein KSP40_PGU002885 [Platanthera guangdongensis]|uniref:Uncharacterized protein n=1 Tax=Platanthera guangdongensis TaxID=2320717 RepID=A0ABR2LFK6_9ASPA